MYLSKVWRDFFINVEPRLFQTPKVLAYRNTQHSACGPLTSNNAFFCPADNTIYYDELFLAAMMKSAAASLGSDGDYAAVVIIAHEWGHAAAYAEGRHRRIYPFGKLQSEQLADCLAGVVTRLAERDGKLAPGDVAEAEFIIYRLGTVDLAGNAPKTLQDGFKRLASHGEPADRLRAFRHGYGGTAPQCLADLKIGGY